jgi:hypothetical protein
MLNPNEEGRFKQLLLYVTDNPGSAYALQIGETTVHTRFDTCYESDNGMEMDEPGYEEYWCIAFQDICSGKLFEISYHNLPEQVWDGMIQVI